VSELSFHLYLPQMRMEVDQIVERALAAEGSGFEGIAFMDHLAPPLAATQPMWEAMTLAAWVLARTERLVVGHLVLCDAFRHPAVLARQAVTLDHASGGRFELGIGWGSVPAELETFGVPAGSAPERVERLRETLSLLRALWSGEPVDHAGRHFSAHGAQQRPVPLRPIPVVIGGIGPKTLELVADHAQWWNVPIYGLDRLAELRGDAGTARLSVQVMVAMVEQESGRAAVEETVRRRFGATSMHEQIVIGSPAELAAHFSSLSDAGVERAYVWFSDFAPPSTLEAFGREVIARR